MRIAGSGEEVTDDASRVEFIGFPTNAWRQSPTLEGLDDPRGVGPLPGGGFLVATRGDGRERTGHGDGGPALAAHLRFPNDVEATPDGDVLIGLDRRVLRFDINFAPPPHADTDANADASESLPASRDPSRLGAVANRNCVRNCTKRLNALTSPQPTGRFGG